MWLRELRSVSTVSRSIRQSVSLVLRGKTPPSPFWFQVFQNHYSLKRDLLEDLKMGAECVHH